MVLSGAKTGRSPKDKHVVREVNTEHDIWWGHESPNTPVDEEYFLSNRERALDYVRAGRRRGDARRAAAATTLTAAAPPPTARGRVTHRLPGNPTHTRMPPVSLPVPVPGRRRRAPLRTGGDRRLRRRAR